MVGKTKVKIIENTMLCRLTKGMIGYIDGYVMYQGEEMTYAIVISGEIVESVLISALKVVND